MTDWKIENAINYGTIINLSHRVSNVYFCFLYLKLNYIFTVFYPQQPTQIVNQMKYSKLHKYCNKKNRKMWKYTVNVKFNRESLCNLELKI